MYARRQWMIPQLVSRSVQTDGNIGPQAAIGELPPVLRDAARMRFVEEASYSEMAEKLAITQENARKRVEQSRRLLRERLRSCFESQS